MTGIFITGVTPVLSNQRAAVMRQGGHVLSRQFRYYVPDFSGRMVVQTPIIVRLVSIFIFHSFFLAVFCGFGFSVFSLLLAVVDYLMKRFGFSRYLSLKIGTNFKVFDLISFFIMDG